MYLKTYMCANQLHTFLQIHTLIKIVIIKITVLNVRDAFVQRKCFKLLNGFLND